MNEEFPHISELLDVLKKQELSNVDLLQMFMIFKKADLECKHILDRLKGLEG